MVDIGLITVDILPITVVMVAVMAGKYPPVVYVQQQGSASSYKVTNRLLALL